MDVAELDIRQRDVAGPLDSALWAAEVTPNPIEAASQPFAVAEFARVEARFPDPGVGSLQQVAPIHLSGEATLLLDVLLGGHGCLPCSAVCVLPTTSPRDRSCTTIRRQRPAPRHDNPSPSRDPRLSAPEPAKPHVRMNIRRGPTGPRPVRGSRVRALSESPRSCTLRPRCGAVGAISTSLRPVVQVDTESGHEASRRRHGGFCEPTHASSGVRPPVAPEHTAGHEIRSKVGEDSFYCIPGACRSWLLRRATRRRLSTRRIRSFLIAAWPPRRRNLVPSTTQRTGAGPTARWCRTRHQRRPSPRRPPDGSRKRSAAGRFAAWPTRAE